MKTDIPSFDICLEKTLRCSRYAQRTLHAEPAIIDELRTSYQDPVPRPQMLVRADTLPTTMQLSGTDRHAGCRGDALNDVCAIALDVGNHGIAQRDDRRDQRQAQAYREEKRDTRQRAEEPDWHRFNGYDFVLTTCLAKGSRRMGHNIICSRFP